MDQLIVGISKARISSARAIWRAVDESGPSVLCLLPGSFN
jgi:hypothetical protein